MGTEAIYDRRTEVEHGSVKKSIETIEQCSKAMAGLFEDFIAAMGVVYQEENFTGNASDELQLKFAELKSKFDGYTDAVERFAKTVEAARASAEAVEKEIQKDAENLSA